MEKKKNMETVWAYYPSAWGIFRIGCQGEAVTEISLAAAVSPAHRASTLSDEVFRQLEAYLQGRRQQFALPLAAAGTAFQQRVWRALQEIPYGEVRSYQQIAQAIGCPQGCRAVGQANGKNPLLIVIPCHRVIGKNGQLTGYRGAGLDFKQRLLSLEQKYKKESLDD